MLNPAIPSDANALLSAHGLRPRKRWGQNFLCDQNVLTRIAGAAALQSGDHVLEIGPGLGGLTRTLASQCESVTAVEIDPLMEPILTETLADYPNVQVIIADFLKLDLGELLDRINQRPSVPTVQQQVDAERPGLGSHAERGNQTAYPTDLTDPRDPTDCQHRYSAVHPAPYSLT